jgi:hypothetical protein
MRSDHLRLLARDLIGTCGAPRDHAGFEVRVKDSGREVRIAAGRYYAGGLLAENDEDCAFEQQPYLPDASEVLQRALAAPGTHIVYLDVWEHDVASFDDPTVCDVALGGPDTQTRSKVVWQVRLARLADAMVGDDVAGRLLESEPAGLLQVSTDSSGYLGLENRCYRIEIHEGGEFGRATFKWSRDNGRVTAAIEAIEDRQLRFGRAIGDEPSSFEVGQWVEIGDDADELRGGSGQLLRIEALDEARRTLTLSAAPRPLGADGQAIDLVRHPTVRGWDHRGGDELGERTSTQTLPLEDGIQIDFSARGVFRPRDYWIFAARTADASVEWPGGDHPQPEPPRRSVHHICHLAQLELDAERGRWRVREDRRKVFRPITASQ